MHVAFKHVSPCSVGKLEKELLNMSLDSEVLIEVEKEKELSTNKDDIDTQTDSNKFCGQEISCKA